MSAAQQCGVTAPRRILPGKTYAVSRRCSQRQFLLRPSKLTNEIFLFVLAVAASRYGVQVHAFCVMSNHYHLLVTDPFARLPEFQQYLDALVARAVNASLGRWETFWGPPTYSAVRLEAPRDVVRKAAYLLANPVAAGLVRRGKLWPGLWSDPGRFGQTIEVQRPGVFFSANGAMPEKITLELTPPPGFASVEEFRDQVVAALAEQEAEAQQSVGHKFVGVARVLAQHPSGRPSSWEPRRKLSPRVAAKDTGQRARALQEDKDFVRDYREALAERRAGKPNVVFPAGTYLLRVQHGVSCAGVT